MVGDESFETIHDGGRVVKECANVRWGDIRTRASKVDTMPADKLVFAAMIVVILQTVVISNGWLPLDRTRDTHVVN